MARLRRPDPPPAEGGMPERLTKFRVEDWCDPTADPPDWYMAALDGRIYWSLAAESSVEDYWHTHALLAYDRARRAWRQEHSTPPPTSWGESAS
jgi:hypothetical protein